MRNAAHEKNEGEVPGTSPLVLVGGLNAGDLNETVRRGTPRDDGALRSMDYQRSYEDELLRRLWKQSRQ